MKQYNIKVCSLTFGIIVKDHQTFTEASKIFQKHKGRLKDIGYPINLLAQIENKGATRLDQYTKLKEGSIIDNNRNSVYYQEILIKGERYNGL